MINKSVRIIPPRALQEAYYRAIESGDMVPDSQGEDLEELGIVRWLSFKLNECC